MAYRTELLNADSRLNECDLARIALLLSYWCPQENAIEVNSYWTDRATRHAKAAIIQDSPDSRSSQYELRLLYWACIVRNTFISFVLRRPGRLHELGNELVKPDEIYAAMETQGRPVTPLDSAPISTGAPGLRNFVWTCKISSVLHQAVASFKNHTALHSQGLVPAWAAGSQLGAGIRRQTPSLVTRFSYLQEFEVQLRELYKEYRLDRPLSRMAAIDRLPIHLNQFITL